MPVYTQGIRDKYLVFNICKILVVYCYAEKYSAGLWRHDNPQDTIHDNSRTLFVVTFPNYTLLWV